ncbi:uncharacterized protein LOC131937784 isoform X2 [Physella acuta]|uniref:uncharacterized protein LOC131937784 isoform X2 n=1 Tax=Physella acuta TaxID=109671 RepID=UPI0027DC5B7A|nr:uncharacterized protein LOC131937784 isoform X2 [Physella acuta]
MHNTHFPLRILVGILLMSCTVHIWSAVDAEFILTNTTITTLAGRGSVLESHACNSFLECRQSLNNTVCKDKNVCQEILTCNGRNGWPSVEYPMQTWDYHNTSDRCTVMNSLPLPYQPPTSHWAGYRTLLVNSSSAVTSVCYFHMNSSTSSSFTLVFWLSASCQNCSVLEMKQANSKPSLYLRATNTSICLDQQQCVQQPDIKTNLSVIFVRVIGTQLKIFIGNSVLNKTDINITDLYIGTNEGQKNDDHFFIFGVEYYKDALTNREMSYLTNGQNDTTTEFKDCQCPIDLETLTSGDNCTNNILSYPRLNRTITYYDLGVVFLNSTTKKWASPDHGSINFTINLNGSFQIETISIAFDSQFPNQVYATFISSESISPSRNLTCDNKICKLTMSFLNKTSPIADYMAQIAEKINIIFERKNKTEVYSYIISSIIITGRCDCHGNAGYCSEINGDYVCSCEARTHTQGPHCRTCSPAYFRTLDDFDCPNKCDCHPDGVVSSADPCAQTNGVCNCKTHVKGARCDMCKPFTYNLAGTNIDGCTPCICNSTGALSCNNVTGACTCKNNTRQPSCDGCIDAHYGFFSLEGCTPCSCQTSGTVNQSTSCAASTGACFCKQFVEGQKCDACKKGYYYLEAANLSGCKSCTCHLVGSEDEQCDANTGQCPCKGGVVTDLVCTPKIESVDPTFGPVSGGTLITISGKLLGNREDRVSIFLANVSQEVLSVSQNQIIIKTKELSFPLFTRPLIVSWEKVVNPNNSQINFTYKPNPVIETSNDLTINTFMSGGCAVPIYGSDLQSVKYPFLKLARNVTTDPIGTCRHNYDNVICQTPNLNRTKTTPKESLQIKAVFDSIEVTLGSLNIQPDPVFNDMGNIRFQYPFEDTITLYGKDLTGGCNVKEYNVYLGVISCGIVSISSTQIVCQPPVSPLSGERKLTLEIRIGNIRKEVGTMEYLDLHETTGFIIIVSCIAAFIFLVFLIILIVIFCRWYRRRKNATTNTFNNLETKDPAVSENPAMNTYTELTADAAPKVKASNGHNMPIQMVTIIKEPKLGIVNTSYEDTMLIEEFLPKAEVGLRDDIKQCYIASGYFVLGRTCFIKGQQALLTDGSLQNTSSTSGQKLTIKSLIKPITESELPTWANIALKESLRLRRYKHTHVLSILGIGIDKEKFHILYPHMSQNILKSVIADLNREFSNHQLLSFCQQVADGIKFLASKDVTHKDIAARNCMVDEFLVVKLSDAAFSWDFYPNEYVYDEQRERYLPLRWMAPESLTDGYYEMRTDVWSFAVLVWELMTKGSLPYPDVKDEDVKDCVLNGYMLGKPDDLSEDLYKLLCSCWSSEVEHRPSIAHVSQVLGEYLETDDSGEARK